MNDSSSLAVRLRDEHRLGEAYPPSPKAEVAVGELNAGRVPPLLCPGGPSRGALRLLRSSRYALTQPDAFGAGASRDGQAIAASLATTFALHRRRMRRERSERSVRTQITSFSRLLPNQAIHHCSPTQGDAASPLSMPCTELSRSVSSASPILYHFARHICALPGGPSLRDGPCKAESE